jgi:hypothetical protein
MYIFGFRVVSTRGPLDWQSSWANVGEAGRLLRQQRIFNDENDPSRFGGEGTVGVTRTGG